MTQTELSRFQTILNARIIELEQLIRQRDGNICDRAVSHGHRIEFANSEMFPALTKNSAVINVRAAGAQPESPHAILVDQCRGGTGVYEERCALAVNICRNKEVVSGSPLQTRACKTVGREKLAKSPAG